MRLASIIDAALPRIMKFCVPPGLPCGESGPSICVVISPGVSARYQCAMPKVLVRTPSDQFFRYGAANASS